MVNRQFVCLFLFLFFVTSVVKGQGTANIKISEVEVSNISGLEDEYGFHEPWIELTNTSWSTEELGGCYMTNNRAVLNKKLSAPQRIKLMYFIPRGDSRTSVKPKQQIVFFADGRTNLGTLHLNFKLDSTKTNFVAFYEGDGETLLDSVSVPSSLTPDHSWAAFYDEKIANRVWADCALNKITPQASNENVQVKKDKVAEFKEKDPYGFAMAFMGMSIVFMCLILLSVFFVLFSKVVDWFSKKEKKTGKKVPPTSNDAIISAVIVMALREYGTTMAVIGLALNEYTNNVHDEESGIITIKRQSTPWINRNMDMLKRKIK